MYFQRQLHAAGVKPVHDGSPQPLGLLVPGLNLGFAGLGEGIPGLPNRRRHKEGGHIHAHILGCVRGVLHLLGCPLPDLFRLPGQLGGAELSRRAS